MKTQISAIAMLVAVLPAMTGSAQAADLKDYSAPDIGLEKPALSWTGGYIGAHGGYAWGETTSRDDLDDWCKATDNKCIAKYVGPFGTDSEGVFGGVTIGLNKQSGYAVVGLEADLGYVDLDGHSEVSSSQSGNHQDIDIGGGLYATGTGRLGIALGNTLVYGKGGLAILDGTVTKKTTAPGFLTDSAETFTGYVYGGGVEWAFEDNWTLKVEYLRFDFGSEEGAQTSLRTGHVFENHHDLTIDTVKAGINYRF